MIINAGVGLSFAMGVKNNGTKPMEDALGNKKQTKPQRSGITINHGVKKKLLVSCF